MDFIKSQDTVSLNTGDTAYVLVCTTLVMLMVPGIGLFYSGLSQTKNGLYLILVGLLSLCIVSIQWVVIGYSLSFSTSSNPIFGNLKHVFMLNTGTSLTELAPGVPTLAFAAFQCMFAAITPAIAVGSFCPKIRVLPLCLYIFLWTTFAYDPIAYWNWSKNGWIVKLGGIDFAGGTVVHISSGASSLAFTLYLRLNEPYDKKSHKPQNTLNVFLGTLFVWLGWYGFNSGSALSANARSAIAFISTNTSAVAGALTLMLLKYRENNHKFSVTDLCLGAFTGLIAITPACGFVEVWASLIIGVVSATTCYYSFRIKKALKINDDVDVFATHGVGGIVGSILTGIFASKNVAAYSGTVIAGGWVNQNWKQVPIQLLSVVACIVWSMLWTILVILFMKYVLKIRLIKSVEELEAGADNTELCEALYEYLNFPNGCSKTKVSENVETFTMCTQGHEEDSNAPTRV